MSINKSNNRFRPKLMAITLCLLLTTGISSCMPADPVQNQTTLSVEASSGKYHYSSEWIHVREDGLKANSAPNLILIPGLVSSSEVWSGVITELGKTHHLHIVDVSGFAGVLPSKAIDKGVVIGLVNDLAEYIRQEELNDVTIMGHSMGGFTSLLTARDHAELIDRVIIVDSLPFYPAIFNPAATVATTKAQAKAMGDMVLTLDDNAFSQMQSQTVRRLTKEKQARADVLSWSLESDRATMVQAMADLMATDLRPDLHNIATETHVIYAWDEAMGLPFDIGEFYESQYKGLASLHLTQIDNSFHFIMKDQPEEFLMAVKKALNTN